MKRILIIQGQPDNRARHYLHGLADAYAEGAQSAGHEVRTIELASIDFPLLRSAEDWRHSAPPPAIREAQGDIDWSQHLVICYPLWLGSMPALLKGFLEQVLRPDFAFGSSTGSAKGRLCGRSVRVIVTMGMPAFVYRWYFGAHSLRALERNILKFVGLAPIRSSVVGSVEGSERHRKVWLKRMHALGAAAH